MKITKKFIVRYAKRKLHPKASSTIWKFSSQWKTTTKLICNDCFNWVDAFFRKKKCVCCVVGLKNLAQPEWLLMSFLDLSGFKCFMANCFGDNRAEETTIIGSKKQLEIASHLHKSEIKSWRPRWPSIIVVNTIKRQFFFMLYFRNLIQSTDNSRRIISQV